MTVETPMEPSFVDKVRSVAQFMRDCYGDGGQIHRAEATLVAKRLEECADRLQSLEAELNGVRVCAGVAAMERGEWEAERQALLKGSPCLPVFRATVERAAKEAECAIAQGKAYDAPEYIRALVHE